MYNKKNRPSPLTPGEALSRAQNICSRQEKCCSEIRKKLQVWQLPIENQEQIIASLERDRFIDESRYTDFFVRDKFRFNKWGKIKISFQLKAKEIPDTIIANALNEIPEEEYFNTLKELLTTKIKTIKDNDTYQIRGKLLRFAQGRGFEPQISYQIIDQLLM